METMTDLAEQMIVGIHLKRDLHDNGMSITDYADAVIAGTQPALSHDEYVYQFGAVVDELDLVAGWAMSNGYDVVESSVGKALVKIRGTVDQFNKSFAIRLKTVVEDDRTYITHDGDITIPSDIDAVVEQVLGLDNSLFLTRNIRSMEVTEEGATPHVDQTPAPPGYPAKAYVTPQQVATAYQLPPGDGYGQSVAIIEFDGSGWSQTDVNNTFSYGGISTPPTIINYSVDGVVGSTTTDGETILDIWCAGGVVPKANIVIYYAPNTGQGFIDNILAVVNDTVNNPSVLSISWGYSSESAADYLNTTFAACAVKNILVFNATGDNGGNNQVAQYPATNAYVIASGGTSIWLNNDNSLNTQRAWTGGGGGVSTRIARPSWQATPPIYYTPYTWVGNVIGSSSQVTTRGVPDISAPADGPTGYRLYIGYPSMYQSGGTSAAAPFLAGFFARLNSLLGRRIQFGELMSLLYSTAGVTTDVTAGSNTRDWQYNGGVGRAVNGYNSTTGWDACTGLGSPIGTAIYKLLHTGETYPKINYGFRAATGAVYPRAISGARNVNASYFIPFNSTTTTASATNAKLGGRTDYTGSANTNSGVSVAWTIGASSVSVTATGIPFHGYYNSAAANIPAIQNYSKTWTYAGGTNVAGTQPGTGGGKIGLWLNGISMFNPSAQGGSPGMGYATYANWHYNAAYEAGTELGYSFGEDDAGAHAAPPNEYHYHDGSMIVSGAWTLGVGHTSGTYGNGGIAECSVIPYLNGGLTHPDGHSKIMGICADGYPVYGPYGYATATNAKSGIRRMVPGYTLNNVRTPNGPTPTVNATYPLGMFVEDWTFTGGGDLDIHNGRYCVTPEYPAGTYAYFLAFNASMKPTYPYVIGNTYYGTPAVL